LLNHHQATKATIFALASAAGRAGVAVIRLSGPKSYEVLCALTGFEPQARHAHLARLTYKSELIDQALILWFPGPKSFTGEDCAELHIHGSKAISERLFHILTELGLRLAEPGEFSRRAFENGKLDLTQAEAIADLVDAENEAQRHQALRQLDGGLKQIYQNWKDQLLRLSANIEVLIDFPDEEIPDSLSGQVITGIRNLKDELNSAIRLSKRGQQIREGFKIAIMGKPNAGKSSLFNALLQSDAAIVTPIAGTTRDVLEAELHLGAHKVLIYDTAGLRDTDDVVESEGIRRARLKGDQADLRLFVIDVSDALIPEFEPQTGDYLIFNKMDLASSSPDLFPDLALKRFYVSLTGEAGASIIKADLSAFIAETLSSQAFPAATRARHKDRLIVARDALDRALEIGFRVPELCAEDLRHALSAFDDLFGRQDVEQVLDHIFSNFCIGK